jgi:hypothetical protein
MPPPPGRNANGRSLGGRKQIQSSPQSHTEIYFAQARRELETDWRTRATLQEDEQLQLDLPQEEQLLLGFLEEVLKKRDRDATASILQPNSSHIKS